MNNNTYNNKYSNTYKEYEDYRKSVVPLCAAENVMSEYAMSALSNHLQEHYIMGGTQRYNPVDNFIGSQSLFPFYEQISEMCRLLFNSTYACPRTLSGMNATTTLMMSLTKIGDNILLLDPENGGHQSFPAICQRLGLKVEFVPFDNENYRIDTEILADKMLSTKYKAVLLPPSDILFPPDFSALPSVESCPIVYDATQTLGLIASKHLPNPLEQHDNIIMCGGTHKTIPGPTCGLIMCNNLKLIDVIDSKINPIFIRNTQMNQVACLLLTLIEFLEFGKDYMNQILSNCNVLATELKVRGFNIAQKNGCYTKTHQLFMLLDNANMHSIYEKCLYHKITINTKNKALLKGNGIRLGLQEVSRYMWGREEMVIIADIFNLIANSYDKEKVSMLTNMLIQKKKIHFCYQLDS